MGENNTEKGKKLGDKIFGAHNNPLKDSEYNDSFDIDQSHKILSESYDEEEYLYRKRLEELFKPPDGFLSAIKRKFLKI